MLKKLKAHVGDLQRKLSEVGHQLGSTRANAEGSRLEENKMAAEFSELKGAMVKV